MHTYTNTGPHALGTMAIHLLAPARASCAGPAAGPRGGTADPAVAAAAASGPSEMAAGPRLLARRGARQRRGNATAGHLHHAG